MNREDILDQGSRYWKARRAQDVILSILSMIVLCPFLIIVALVIYIDDPHGNPIYTQIRCGRDGKLFKMYKFRSMYVNADEQLETLRARNEMDGPAFKMKDDPRVTRVGRFIRKTSIDELPQLWNVIEGTMSIVGPRPALPKEVAQYTEYERQRMYITPGLTCYWQIQPRRNDLRFDEWVELDIKYMKERSFLVDWKIILRTARAMLMGYGE